MLYTKPEVRVIGNAMTAIEGDKIGCHVDNPEQLTAGCAYQADE